MAPVAAVALAYGAQVSPCPAPNALNGCNPDFLNVDLTATKKIGKWKLGAVGDYSADLNAPTFNYAKQSQFAAGPLLGYNFGPVTAPPAAATTTPLYRKG